MENQQVIAVDLETLSEEQIQGIENSMIQKISPIFNKAIEEANALLKPYGLSVRVYSELEEIPQKQ